MKLRYYTVFILLLKLSVLCYCQRYSCIEIHGINNQTINDLSSIGFPLEDASFDYVTNIIKIIVNEKDISNLESKGIKYQVTIADMQTWFRERNQKSSFKKTHTTLPIGFQYGSLMGYPNLTEIIHSLDTMFLMYPHFSKEKVSIGTTIEGRDIYLMKLSNYSKTNNKKKILFTSLHHAREGASVTTLLYYMFYILENYGKDPIITFILDNRELYFIPVVNPDGYAYNEETNPEGGGLWRKNRTVFAEGIGVDLNRNYSYKWETTGFGTATYPWQETYKGPSAFSELETQAIKKLVETNEFISAVNYHSYGNYFIYPWGYTTTKTADIEQYRYIARKIVANNKYLYGNTNQLLGYSVNGNSDDWLYGDITKNKCFAYTVEVGNITDYFWPLVERIEPIAKENIFTNNYISLSSSALIDSIRNTAPIETAIGDTINATLCLFNEGLSTADSVKLIIKTEDPYLDIISNLYTIKDVKPFSLSDSVIFQLTFKNETPLNHITRYNVEGTYNGFPFNKEFFIRRVSSGSFEYENINVESTNNNITLTWSTITERACSSFEIERRYQNSNFEVIASIQSDGKHGENYSYNDYPKNSGIYTYRIKAIVDQRVQYSKQVYIDYKYVPLRYDLSQNYPNPANPSTTIAFYLPQDTRATLTVYNILGERVMTVFDKDFSAGNHSVLVNFKHLSSQVYFYELKALDFKTIKRMLILK